MVGGLSFSLLEEEQCQFFGARVARRNSRFPKLVGTFFRCLQCGQKLWLKAPSKKPDDPQAIEADLEEFKEPTEFLPAENPDAPGWFYEELGEPKGPVSLSALRSLADLQEIGPETLVKSPDGQWVPAVKVKELNWHLKKEKLKHMGDLNSTQGIERKQNSRTADGAPLVYFNGQHSEDSLSNSESLNKGNPYLVDITVGVLIIVFAIIGVGMTILSNSKPSEMDRWAGTSACD